MFCFLGAGIEDGKEAVGIAVELEIVGGVGTIRISDIFVRRVVIFTALDGLLQHANKAIDEVRRAEFFRKGGRMRGVVKGKRWLLLTRWMNLDSQKRQQLNELFALNRRVMKAYLLKESLERLWTYRYEGAMLRYLQSWIDQLRWQRLVPFQNLAFMLLDHLDGILNYCRTKVRFGVVEAINGNIKTLFRRGRGYKNLGYLLLKAQRMAVTKTEFIVLQKAA